MLVHAIDAAVRDCRGSKDREIFQQRDDANDDDDHAHDLLRTAIKRQHVDEIKYQNDDDESNECANEDVHSYSPFDNDALGRPLNFAAELRADLGRQAVQ
jgi:hypothetical protein